MILKYFMSLVQDVSLKMTLYKARHFRMHT